MSAKNIIVGLAALSLLGGLLYFASQGSQTTLPAASLAAFQDFRKKYGKTYLSMAEIDYRLGVFHENLEYIDAHNRKNLSWTLGVNKFSDLTWDEFRAAYLRDNAPGAKIFDGPVTYPMIEERNWKDKGMVTPVKDQGACGDCYAFGALSSFESALAMKYNKHIVVSEKEIIDCSGSYGNNGCKGGEVDQCYKYIRDKSINLLEDYPYTPKAEACTKKSDKPRYRLHHWKHIKPINMDGLLAALDDQPVTVCFECRKDFHQYKKGVYEGEDDCGDNSLNHCVLVYGYGHDKGLDMDYTHHKNSWGSDWGEEGNFRMKIRGGSGTCGIATNDAVYPVLNKDDN